MVRPPYCAIPVWRAPPRCSLMTRSELASLERLKGTRHHSHMGFPRSPASVLVHPSAGFECTTHSSSVIASASGSTEPAAGGRARCNSPEAAAAAAAAARSAAAMAASARRCMASTSWVRARTNTP